MTFGGRPIRSVNQFKNILGIYPKGWKLPLTYRRDGQKRKSRCGCGDCIAQRN